MSYRNQGSLRLLPYTTGCRDCVLACNRGWDPPDRAVAAVLSPKVIDIYIISLRAMNLDQTPKLDFLREL